MEGDGNYWVKGYSYHKTRLKWRCRVLVTEPCSIFWFGFYLIGIHLAKLFVLLI